MALTKIAAGTRSAGYECSRNKSDGTRYEATTVHSVLATRDSNLRSRFVESSPMQFYLHLRSAARINCLRRGYAAKLKGTNGRQIAARICFGSRPASTLELTESDRPISSTHGTGLCSTALPTTSLLE